MKATCLIVCTLLISLVFVGCAATSSNELDATTKTDVSYKVEPSKEKLPRYIVSDAFYYCLDQSIYCEYEKAVLEGDFTMLKGLMGADQVARADRGDVFVYVMPSFARCGPDTGFSITSFSIFRTIRNIGGEEVSVRAGVANTIVDSGYYLIRDESKDPFTVPAQEDPQ